jgi:DNA invertase Pin-like site-specific DNA recombinase
MSGAKAERPGLQQAVAYLREGDTLVVWKLDRLGQSLRDLLTIMADLEQRGIGLKGLEAKGLVTIARTPGGKAEAVDLTAEGRNRAAPLKESCE